MTLKRKTNLQVLTKNKRVAHSKISKESKFECRRREGERKLRKKNRIFVDFRVVKILHN